jgi:nitrogen fixation protein NifU and related proteins
LKGAGKLLPAFKPPESSGSITGASRNIMQNEDFNFWQHHSLRFLEMAFRSDKRETLTNSNGYGKESSACGDTVEIFLEIADDQIVTAAFATNGCLNTVACANTVIHLAEGKNLDAAREITAEAVINHLESLPAEESHCAEMAVAALNLALSSAAGGNHPPGAIP